MDRPQSVVDAIRTLGLSEPRREQPHLGTVEIAELFREHGAAHLWITDPFGDIKRRIAPNDCFAFWKDELNGRVMEDPRFVREQWLGGTAYLVSAWTSPFPEPLLELRRCE